MLASGSTPLQTVSRAIGVYAVAPDGALTLTATVHGLPAYDGSNGMEGIVAT